MTLDNVGFSQLKSPLCEAANILRGPVDAADIDNIMKRVRFPDWQRTTQGERLIQRELRKTLLKCQLHRGQDLFDRAFAHIRQYYWSSWLSDFTICET